MIAQINLIVHSLVSARLEAVARRVERPLVELEIKDFMIKFSRNFRLLAITVHKNSVVNTITNTGKKCTTTFSNCKTEPRASVILNDDKSLLNLVSIVFRTHPPKKTKQHYPTLL